MTHYWESAINLIVHDFIFSFWSLVKCPVVSASEFFLTLISNTSPSSSCFSIDLKKFFISWPFQSFWIPLNLQLLNFFDKLISFPLMWLTLAFNFSIRSVGLTLGKLKNFWTVCLATSSVKFSLTESASFLFASCFSI